MEQLIPEYLTDGELAAIKERHGAIELIVLDIAESCHRLLMHPAKSGCEQPDRSRAVEIGGLVLEAEASFGYAKGQACIDLAEMPGKLPD